jgi:hypothetical protein
MKQNLPIKLTPIRLDEKLLLTAEILAAYVPAMRILRAPDVTEMARRAREVTPDGPISQPGLEHQIALRLGRAVSRTLALLPTDSRCLIRSLVTLRLLARRRMDSKLVIGVRNEGSFQAHAWVEHQGRPILPSGSYIRLTEL